VGKVHRLGRHPEAVQGQRGSGPPVVLTQASAAKARGNNGRRGRRSCSGCRPRSTVVLPIVHAPGT
jgi:hypothetical protein